MHDGRKNFTELKQWYTRILDLFGNYLGTDFDFGPFTHNIDLNCFSEWIGMKRPNRGQFLCISHETEWTWS